MIAHLVADIDHKGDGRRRRVGDRYFFGHFRAWATAIGPKAKPVIAWCQSLSDIMFRFTEYVMKFAPIGVGAAMAYTVGHNEQGLGVLFYLGKLVLTLYGALVAFAVLVLLPIALIFKVPLKDFFNAVKTPASIAFATTSSESALPKAMENLARLGVPRRIVGFVLPTGYSFNLDGTTLYPGCWRRSLSRRPPASS